MHVGTSRIDIAFQMDQLSAMMLLVVTGVGEPHPSVQRRLHGERPGYARYFAYLNLFIVFMLVLVLGVDLPVLFIGWEGVGLCSYLLIGFWFGDKANADAGKKAFIANRVGDFGLLMAMFLLWWTLGTLDFTEIVAQAPTLLTHWRRGDRDHAVPRCSAAPASRRRSRSTPGCPTPWRARRRSRP